MSSPGRVVNGGSQCRLVRAAHVLGRMPLAQVSAALLRGAGVSLDEAAVAAALTLLEPFKDVAADDARAACAALEGTPSRHQETVDQLERIEAIRADFGEDRIRELLRSTPEGYGAVDAWRSVPGPQDFHGRARV